MKMGKSESKCEFHEGETRDYSHRLDELVKNAKEKQRKEKEEQQLRRKEQWSLGRREMDTIVDNIYKGICTKIDSGDLDTLATSGIPEIVYFESYFVGKDTYNNYHKYFNLAQKYSEYKGIRIILQGNCSGFKLILRWSDEYSSSSSSSSDNMS